MSSKHLLTLASSLLLLAPSLRADVLAEWDWSSQNNSSAIATESHDNLTATPEIIRGSGLTQFQGGAKFTGFGFASDGWDNEATPDLSFADGVANGHYLEIALPIGDDPVNLTALDFHWLRQTFTDVSTIQWAYSTDDWQTTHLIAAPLLLTEKGFNIAVSLDLSTIDQLQGLVDQTVRFRCVIWGRDPADLTHRAGFTSGWAEGDVAGHDYGLRFSGDVITDATSGTVIELGALFRPLWIGCWILR